MSPSELAFWARAQRRVALLEPELQQAILRAFAVMRQQIGEGEFARIVASGDIDRLFAEALSRAELDRALMPLRQRLRAGIAQNVRYFANTVPGAGRVDGVIAIAFDYLNPKVIDAIRVLETRVITTLEDDVRDTVRAYVENGLRDGVNPREVARGLRSVIGLAPNQLAAVENFEVALRGGDVASVYSSALDYKLRDLRFDSTLAKAMLNGEKLPEQKITTMVDAYRKKMVAFNAETNARTAALDALKLGQHLTWQDAVDRGIVDGALLHKRWSGVMDSRERPTHVAMQGEVARWDQTYSNGQLMCGDTEFNCRCLSMYFVARAA